MASLPPWSLSLCHCFGNVSKSMSLQRLYEIHQDCGLDCPWTLQARKASETQVDYVRQVIEQDRLAKQQQQIERARLAKKRQEAEQVRAYKAYLARQEQWERDEQARLLKEQQQADKEAEEARIAKEQEEARLTAFACRRCPAKYPSNTKLHEHIRDHHAKKPKPVSNPPTPPTSPPTSPQSIPSLPESPKPAPQPKALPTPPTSSQSVSSSADSLKPAPQPKALLPTPPPSPPQSITASPNSSPKPSPPTSPKRSLLSGSAPEFVPKRSESASPTPPQKPAAMRPTPPSKSTSKTPSKRPYLTIEDLHRMFAGKDMRTKLFATQNSSFSLGIFAPRQARITAYFLPTSSAPKSTKSEASTSVYGSVKQSARASPPRSPIQSFRRPPSEAFFSAFSKSSPICWRCQGPSTTYLPSNWSWSIAARAGIPMGRRGRRLFV